MSAHAFSSQSKKWFGQVPVSASRLTRNDQSVLSQIL